MDTDVTLMVRRMLRDIVECENHDWICRRLGLVPSSPDVDDREHYESHRRIEPLKPMAQEIFDTADIAAEVVLRLSTVEWNEPPTPDDIEQTSTICRAACMAVLIQLVDSGRILINPTYRES